MVAQHDNPTFINDNGRVGVGVGIGDGVLNQRYENVDLGNGGMNAERKKSDAETTPERDTWGKGVEFLMSCIAMSVGLGNVWRFPFTALENGGGVFVISYIVVLLVVGKPIYYLEMIIGQFSSRGAVKVFDLCPALRGVGVGQAFMVFILTTYYESLCAVIAYYLVESFRDPLPWAYCRPEWGENCIDSSPRSSTNETSTILKSFENISFSGRAEITERLVSSSELYFVKEVLHEKENINDGLGQPIWELVICLLVSWLCVFLVIMRGVQSSGKASYFLAIFPYVIMLVLLIRAVTLPGSGDGIIYFIKPDWKRFWDPKVWYAAVTQCFFSLNVCFGSIVMYSSYNKFSHNVYRDAMIVTTLDTFTSLLAGCTIFGILGHLAHETGTTDIGSVIKGGPGLAFISYPDAIAKFKKLPQIFSVLFFLMLFILGIGSNIAITSCTVTSIRDYFPKIKQWQCALGVVVTSFCIGLIYVTPGGQFMLTLVDYHGPSMIALILGIIELYLLGWVYGTKRLCKDVEFMLGRKLGLYWRLCWSHITPIIMTIILIYFFATYTSLTYNNVIYPDWAYGFGWTITAIGVLQVPIWFCVAVIRRPERDLWAKVRASFRPKRNWGPANPLIREQYLKEIENDFATDKNLGIWGFYKNNVFG